MTPQPRRRTAVLISGRGSNLESLARAARDPEYPADLSLVISSSVAAPGLARAAAHGIPTCVMDPAEFASRAAFGEALDARLRQDAIELVCLAGFMHVLDSGIVGRWQGRMLNIHPSLLPLYPGLDTHARVLADGCSQSGCTVHVVTAELDAGPVIARAEVPVRKADTPETLAARVLKAEHRLYPEALARVARGPASVGN